MPVVVDRGTAALSIGVVGLGTDDAIAADMCMIVVCVVPAAAGVTTVVFIAQISVATDFVVTVIDFTVTAAMGLVAVNRGSAAPGI